MVESGTSAHGRLRLIAGVRMFSSAPDAPRLRRGTDLALLLVSVLGLAALSVAAPGPGELDSAITDLVRAVPGAGGWLWRSTYLLLVVWALVLVAAVLVRRRRRRLLIDVLLAAAFVLPVVVVGGWLGGTSWSASLAAIRSGAGPAVYLGALLACATAVVVVLSPHLSRPVRAIGRGVLFVGAVAGIWLGVAYPVGMAAGFLAGVAAASSAHLVLGSPDGRLTPDQVTAELAELGVVVSGMHYLEEQGAGVARLGATSATGEALVIKAYGRDARESRALASVWRSLWQRGETPQLARGRRELVEHEALVTVLAERGGVPVPGLVAVGVSAQGDGLVVTTAAGRPLDQLGADEVDDPLLAATWAALLELHALGVAHGHIDGRHVVVDDDGSPRLTDFADAELRGTDIARQTDRARLLVTTALVVGHDRAVAAAHGALAPDDFVELLPYLQPAALDRSSRSAVHHGTWDLAALRSAAVAVAETEPPELQRIRRVSVRSILLLVGGGVLAYFLISKLADVDFSSLWAELSSAQWSWLAGGLVASLLIQVGFSFSTLGASVTPLRYGPVLALQYAIQFIAVALPATAARLALEVRFFQRFGIPAAAALSIGLVDSVSGFVVQVLLLLLIGLSGLPGLTGEGSLSTSSDDTSTDSSSGHLIALAVVLVLVAMLIAIALPSTRRRIRAAVPRWRALARTQAAAARTALGVVRHPLKVLEMLGGNLGAQLMQAAVLSLCLRAFGAEAAFSQLILINTLVSLFAGLMPVPGGVGVVEAGLTAGLQAVGIDSSTAISTALGYRMLTFYLPPIWGGFAMRWLRGHSYV